MSQSTEVHSTPTKILDLDEIKQRIQEQQVAATEAAIEAAEERYKYIKPFSVAAPEYIEQVSNADARYYTGFKEVDKLARGFAPGELVVFMGREGNGKTQFVLNSLANNPQKHTLIFTPDETPSLVLAKLVAIKHGIAGDRLEEGVKAGDTETLRLVRETASHDFQNLIVVGETYNLREMTYARKEAEDLWQHPVQLVVFDYVELAPGDGDYTGVQAKFRALKRWGGNLTKAPFVAIHQAKKGEGRGVAQGLDGMRYGGADAATMVFEVYRKKFDKGLSQVDRMGHDNTVTVDLIKNKRPPSKLASVDFYLEPETGLIRSLQEGDLIRSGAATRSALAMVRARKETV